jgi:glycosyltransferase involved in cell wall biosynthesis
MQSNGVEAYSVSIVSDTTFDYGKDIFFPYRDGIRDPKSLLNWASKRFGIFHFYFRTTSNYVINGEISDEVYQDIHILRSLGAKTIMHFRGSEVRVQSLFKKCNRFAWGDEEDHFPGGDIFRTKILNTSRGLFDKLLVTDAELQSYVDKSEVLERAVDFEKIDAALTAAKADISRTENKTIRIAHAPSRRALKGTQIVLETVQSLMDEGISLEIDIIENVTNEDALVRLASADLVIDQMRIGWYGVLTVEAMALGKPTVAYIRDDLVEKLEKECPILVTNPDQLKHDLSEWVKNSSKLKEVGKASRRFAKKYHCSKVVAKKALKIYETL